MFSYSVFWGQGYNLLEVNLELEGGNVTLTQCDDLVALHSNMNLQTHRLMLLNPQCEG